MSAAIATLRVGVAGLILVAVAMGTLSGLDGRLAARPAIERPCASCQASRRP